MDTQLEKILEEVNNNLLGRISSVQNNGGDHIFDIYEDCKYIDFIGPFRLKARSMKELEPLFQYMKKNGYKSNLD